MGLLSNTPAAKQSNLSLIIANLIPIYGVLFLGWKVFDVVIFYWLETIIIGLFNVIKIYLCQGDAPKNNDEAAKAMGPFFEWANEQGKKNGNKNETSIGGKSATDLNNQGKGFISIFFLFHYNFFIFVQFIFVMAALAPSHLNAFNPLDMIRFIQENTDYLFLGILGLVISHAHSLLVNFYWRGEYLSTNASIQMFKPYVRIFIQQFVVIIGAMFVSIFNAPIILLIILIILKIVVDLISHNYSHRPVGTTN